MSAEAWANVTVAAYAACFLSTIVFVAFFLGTNWRAHPWGRNVMAVMVVLGLQEGVIVFRRLGFELPWRYGTIAVLAWLFAITVAWRASLQVQARMRQRRERRRRAIAEAGRKARHEGVQVPAGGLADDAGGDPGWSDRG